MRSESVRTKRGMHNFQGEIPRQPPPQHSAPGLDSSRHRIPPRLHGSDDRMRTFIAFVFLMCINIAARADEPGARNKTQPSPPALNLLDGLKSGQLAVKAEGTGGAQLRVTVANRTAAPSASSSPGPHRLRSHRPVRRRHGGHGRWDGWHGRWHGG